MTDEEIGYSCPPPVCGVKTPLGDPNETCDTMPHIDVIHTKLLAAMKDESLPLEDRQAAEKAFKQMYPDKKT